MIDEIVHWNKEMEEGIAKRREVKNRIRLHWEALKAEQERNRNQSVLSGMSKSAEGKPGASIEAEKSQVIVEPEKPDTDSDEDYLHIDIKRRLKEFVEANPEETRVPTDMLNEAVRWRLT